MTLILGNYKHYKGEIYQVIGIAKHTETLEELVVYHAIDKNKPQIWIRPLDMFESTVDYGGQIVPRFKLIE